MDRMNNFDLPYYDGMQLYDADEIKNRNIVKANYWKKNGHEGNPNICALPELCTGEELLRHLTFLPEFPDKDMIGTMTVDEKMNLLYMLKDRLRIMLPHYKDVDANLHNIMVRSYASRDYCYMPFGRMSHINGEDKKISISMDKNGLMSTAPGFLIIGTAGSGKTSSVLKSLQRYPRAILHDSEEGAYVQIPYILTTAPPNGNIAALYMDVVRKVDALLNNDGIYEREMSGKNLGKATGIITKLINQCAVGVIIIDEIQLVVNSQAMNRSFESFLSITQNTGVGLCCIGTPDALDRFDLRMGRRLTENIIRSDSYCEDQEYLGNLVSFIWKYDVTGGPKTIPEEIREYIVKTSGGSIDSILNRFIAVESLLLKNPTMEVTARNLEEKLTTGFTKRQEDMIKASVRKNRGFLTHEERLKKEAGQTGKEQCSESSERADLLEECRSLTQSILIFKNDYTEQRIKEAYFDLVNTDQEFTGLTMTEKGKKLLVYLEEVDRRVRRGKKNEDTKKKHLIRKNKITEEEEDKLEALQDELLAHVKKGGG